MAKIESSQILKPGAVLEVKKIDFNDPKVKAFVAEAKRQQKMILQMGIVSRKKLEQVVDLPLRLRQGL